MKERRESQDHDGRSSRRRPIHGNRQGPAATHRPGWSIMAMRSTAMRGPASAAENWPRTWSRRRCLRRFSRAIGSRTGRRCGPGSARFSGTRSSITTAVARLADGPVRRSSGQPPRVRSTRFFTGDGFWAKPPRLEDARAGPDGRRVLERARRLPGRPAANRWPRRSCSASSSRSRWKSCARCSSSAPATSASGCTGPGSCFATAWRRDGSVHGPTRRPRHMSWSNDLIQILTTSMRRGVDPGLEGARRAAGPGGDVGPAGPPPGLPLLPAAPPPASVPARGTSAGESSNRREPGRARIPSLLQHGRELKKRHAGCGQGKRRPKRLNDAQPRRLRCVVPRASSRIISRRPAGTGGGRGPRRPGGNPG